MKQQEKSFLMDKLFDLIKVYDDALEPEICEKLIEKFENLSDKHERIDNDISEYCKILIMIKLKVKIITTNDIDEIWKNHLITKQYIDDCYYFFGDYLDYADMTINNNAEIKQNMINMYKKYFCQDFVF